VFLKFNLLIILVFFKFDLLIIKIIKFYECNSKIKFCYCQLKIKLKINIKFSKCLLEGI
jgi:hypothetical protein